MLDAPKGTQWPRRAHANNSSCSFCTNWHKFDCLPWDADIHLGENFEFSHSYHDNRPMYKSNFLTNFFGCDSSGNLLPDFKLDLASILESAIDTPQKTTRTSKALKKNTSNTVTAVRNPKSTKSNQSLPSTDPLKLLTILYEKQLKQEENIQKLAEMLNGIQRTLETRSLASNEQSESLSLPEFIEGSSNRALEQSANNLMEVYDDGDGVEGDEDTEEDMIDDLWGEDFEDEDVL